MMLEGILLVAALWVLSLHLRLRRDLHLLREGVLALHDGRGRASPNSFSHPAAARLWRAILLFRQSQRGHRELQSDFQEALRSGDEIVQHLEGEETVCEATCELLLHRLSPDVSAASVFLLGRGDETPLVSSRGVSPLRLQGPLQSYLECLQDEEERSPRRVVGFQCFSDETSCLLNFATLGFPSVALLPLRKEGQLLGAFWLGFPKRMASVSAEKRDFIRAFVEHCASSFVATRHFQDRLRDSRKERDWLLGMSHDLRAPGTSALYSLRDLLSLDLGPLTKEQALRLQIIEDCLNEQLALVGDILDLAKHRQGLLDSQKERVLLPEVLQPLLDGYVLQAKKKGLGFHVEELPLVFCDADPRQLRRIFDNLLSNAYKYTDSGAIRLSGHLSGELFEVEVSDSGIGIPEAEQHRLFHDFRRFENAASRIGVGLGLSVAKMLAEKNGGTLRYRPRAGGGSVFTLSLPISEVARASSTKDAEQRIAGFPYASILLVDDDCAVQRTHARYLQGMADAIFTATTCDEAISLLSAVHPEVVISDLHLEKETSERLLAAVRASSREVQLLLTTGSGKRDFLHNLEKKYQLQVLEKPLSREILRDRLRR